MTDNTMEYMTVSMCGADALDWCSGYNEAVTKANEIINHLQAVNERLEYTLLGVMHSVDKWLDGAELEQDEVNRAATMREKTLRIIESQDAEIERLEANNLSMQKTLSKMSLGVEQARAKAIKDFAKRLKHIKKRIIIIYDEDIDNLVKEMIGEQS